MTIEEKLNSIRETKEAIKTSIKNKGVDVADTDPFSTYAEKIDSIESGGGDVTEYFNTNPSEITTGSTNTSWIGNNYILKLPDIVVPENTSGVATFRDWKMPILPKLINVENLKGNCEYMFSGCGTKNYDVSEWNTKKITGMNYMFSNCSIEELDLSKWDLSSLTTAQHIFRNSGAKKILAPNLCIPGRDSNLTFYGCSNLETIDISNWDTTKRTSFSEMFYNCKKLTQLDLKHLDTSSATNFERVFYMVNVLTDLDISTWDFSKAIYISNLFYSCPNLTNLAFGKNLGKGYTSKSANNGNYTLTLSSSKLLTHDSLMNVINNLYDLNLTYDVANGGTLYTQKLVLGADNIAKLSEEELAICTTKGWSVS